MAKDPDDLLLSLELIAVLEWQNKVIIGFGIATLLLP